MAGQGLNLGLSDAKVLAEILLNARKNDEPMGHYAVLRRYERQQKGLHLGLLALMEGFKQLFSNDALPAVLLRNQGLSLVNQLPFAKKWLIQQAAGA